MRSTIDWNEIVPLLKQGLRDTLYMEAITLLSNEAPKMMPYRREGRVRGVRIPGNTLKKGLRIWGANGDGQRLCHATRVFRIVKDSKYAPRDGHAGQVWKKLTESKNETISYPGIASICKGVGVEKAKWSAVAGAFWARGLLEVVPGKDHKVGDAY